MSKDISVPEVDISEFEEVKKMQLTQVLRMSALEKLLIEKGIITQKEHNDALSEVLLKFAESLSNTHNKPEILQKVKDELSFKA